MVTSPEWHAGAADPGVEGGAGGTGGPSSSCEPGTNLLLNSSFEVEGDNLAPAFWKQIRHARDGGDCFPEQDELVLSGSYRVNRLTTTEISIIVNDEASDAEQLWLPLDLPTAVDTWVPFEVELVAPSAAFNVNLWAIGPYNNEPATTLWFDDVRLAGAP